MAEGYISHDDDDDDDVDDSHDDQRQPLFAGPSTDDGLVFDTLDREHIESDDLHGDHPREELGGWAAMWLAYQSIGAIYGDIGTSPLYVFSATFVEPPEAEDLVGVLSMIIWALLLVATVKYVGIVLCANDHGEGGSFALLSLLRRHLGFDWRDSTIYAPENGKGQSLMRFNLMAREVLKKSRVARRAISILAVLGVCMVMSDGVLTPAQSILGAVQGFKEAVPGMATNTIVAITCVLIVILFAIQPFGTSRLSNYFAPVVMVWLSANMCFGIYNIVRFDSAVLRAFSPAYAVGHLTQTGIRGWKALGGVLLSVTGVEALFADLGAFSVKAIRVSWLSFALPCLLVTYCGQAAFISEHPDAVANPLFKSAPPGTFWPTLVLSMITSIVASQAMLTGTFQLISQAINMSYLPKIRAVHTSSRITSQIYIPMANWVMMIGSLGVTVMYKNTTRLGNAYGTCVIGVSFITTWLVTLVAIVIWNVHFLLVIPLFLFIVIIDSLFLSAALAKIPSGGWFTVVLATMLSSALLGWGHGENCQRKADRDDTNFSRVAISPGKDGSLRLREGKAQHTIKKIRGIGIFLIDANPESPPVFDHFLRKFEAMHEVSILLNIRHVLKPNVAEEDRFTLFPTAFANIVRATLRLGYWDKYSWESFEKALTDGLEMLQLDDDDKNQPRHSDDDIEAEIEARPQSQSQEDTLDEASIPLTSRAGFEHSSSGQKSITYIVGRDKLAASKESGRIRRGLLGMFIWLKNHENTKLSVLKVPGDRTVEVGFSKDI